MRCILKYELRNFYKYMQNNLWSYYSSLTLFIPHNWHQTEYKEQEHLFTYYFIHWNKWFCWEILYFFTFPSWAVFLLLNNIHYNIYNLKNIFDNTYAEKHFRYKVFWRSCFYWNYHWNVDILGQQKICSDISI